MLVVKIGSWFLVLRSWFLVTSCSQAGAWEQEKKRKERKKSLLAC